MWNYQKKLQYPVNIKNPNPKMAKVIISQLGGPNRKRIYLSVKPYNPILLQAYLSLS